MKTFSFQGCGVGALTLLALVCISCGQTPSTMGTGIEGIVSFSPIHPGPTRENEPNTAPLPNISFAVENDSGTVATFVTDEQGKFRVSLKPGHYKVSVRGEKRIRRCGPFEVDVAANGMTTVQWQCDSGMR
jgi:hypothetical protein